MYLQVIMLVKKKLKTFKNRSSCSGMMYKFSHTLLKLDQVGGLYKFSRETIPEKFSSRVEGMLLVAVSGVSA